ncbi:MAG TPA: hypothetical protein VF749_10630 [Candidatus Acidoferrum sp.]
MQGIASWATPTTLAPLAADNSYGSAGNHRSIRVAGRGRDDSNRTYDAVDAINIINQAQQPYERPSQRHLCFRNQAVSWRRVRLRSQRRFQRAQLR